MPADERVVAQALRDLGELERPAQISVDATYRDPSARGRAVGSARGWSDGGALRVRWRPAGSDEAGGEADEDGSEEGEEADLAELVQHRLSCRDEAVLEPPRGAPAHLHFLSAVSWSRHAPAPPGANESVARPTGRPPARALTDGRPLVLAASPDADARAADGCAVAVRAAGTPPGPRIGHLARTTAGAAHALLRACAEYPILGMSLGAEAVTAPGAHDRATLAAALAAARAREADVEVHGCPALVRITVSGPADVLGTAGAGPHGHATKAGVPAQIGALRLASVPADPVEGDPGRGVLAVVHAPAPCCQSGPVRGAPGDACRRCRVCAAGWRVAPPDVATGDAALWALQNAPESAHTAEARLFGVPAACSYWLRRCALPTAAPLADGHAIRASFGARHHRRCAVVVPCSIWRLSTTFHVAVRALEEGALGGAALAVAAAAQPEAPQAGGSASAETKRRDSVPRGRRARLVVWCEDVDDETGVGEVCEGLWRTLRVPRGTTLFAAPDALLPEGGVLNLNYVEDDAVWTTTVVDEPEVDEAEPPVLHRWTDVRKRLAERLREAGAAGSRACPCPFVRQHMHGTVG